MLIFLVSFCTCFTSCRLNHATLQPRCLHHLMTHHQHLLLTSHPSHEPPWWCISAKVSKHPSYWPSRALASTSTTSTNHGRPYSTTTTSSTSNTHGHTTTVDPTPMAVTTAALVELCLLETCDVVSSYALLCCCSISITFAINKLMLGRP